MSDLTAKSRVLHESLEGIKVQFREGHKLHVAWQTSPIKIDVVNRFYNYTDRKQAVRVYDVSQYERCEVRAAYIEISLPLTQREWTFTGLKASRTYCIEVGYFIQDDYFFPIHRTPTLPIIEYEGKRMIDESVSCEWRKLKFPPAWSDRVSTYSYYENSDRESCVKQ